MESVIKKSEKLNYTTRYERSQKFLSILNKNTPFTYVESFKALRTNMDFISSANGVKSILITSTVGEESKSTTAINLALTLAGNGKSVIVVECDLRKPVLRRYLNLMPGKKGLSLVLASNELLEECIIDVKELGISVLPAGTIPPNPSELLNQPKMQEVIQTLKQQYDYVILDTPPVLAVTDAVIVGRMADGALLVVRSKFAPVKSIRLAKQRLDAVNVKVLGAVLTRYKTKKVGGRSGYTYADYKYAYEERNNRN